MSRRRCGWCYKFGHNRITCQSLTDSHKQSAENEVAENKKQNKKDRSKYGLDHYFQKRYAKRIKSDTLLDGTTYEFYRQERETSVRTCSFCGNSGHNRRKCELHTEEKQRILRNTKAYRKGLKKQLSNSGWGIGALIQHRDEIYMVTDIDWSIPSILTLPKQNVHCLTLTHIKASSLPSWQQTRGMALPPLAEEHVTARMKKEIPWIEDVLVHQRQNFWDNEWSSYKLLSGVESFPFPKGWETKMVNEYDVWDLKEHLKQMTHSEKHNNQWSAKNHG